MPPVSAGSVEEGEEEGSSLQSESESIPPVSAGSVEEGEEEGSSSQSESESESE